MPAAYRGTRLRAGILVEVQAASGTWFPFNPCPPDRCWPAGSAGHLRLALALASTRRHHHEVHFLRDDLLRHLEDRFRSRRWQLSAARLDRILDTAAWEESGAADLDPA